MDSALDSLQGSQRVSNGYIRWIWSCHWHDPARSGSPLSEAPSQPSRPRCC